MSQPLKTSFKSILIWFAILLPLALVLAGFIFVACSLGGSVGSSLGCVGGGVLYLVVAYVPILIGIFLATIVLLATKRSATVSFLIGFSAAVSIGYYIFGASTFSPFTGYLDGTVIVFVGALFAIVIGVHTRVLFRKKKKSKELSSFRGAIKSVGVIIGRR